MTQLGDAERWKKVVGWEENPAEDAAKADDGCEKAEQNSSAGDIDRSTGLLDLLDDDCAIKQMILNLSIFVWKTKAKIITVFSRRKMEEAREGLCAGFGKPTSPAPCVFIGGR